MVAQMRNIIVKSAHTLQLGDIILKNTRPGCTRYNYSCLGKGYGTLKNYSNTFIFTPVKKQNIYVVKRKKINV